MIWIAFGKSMRLALSAFLRYQFDISRKPKCARGIKGVGKIPKKSVIARFSNAESKQSKKMSFSREAQSA
ncbi:hypothetical protein [Helicobacter sp. 23-1045]